MTPRGTLELCCVRIAQLMTHPVIYTIPFTLQLCHKLLDMLQRVAKSQRFIHQVMMDCQNFITSILFDIGHRFSQRRSGVEGNQIF